MLIASRSNEVQYTVLQAVSQVGRAQRSCPALCDAEYFSFDISPAFTLTWTTFLHQGPRFDCDVKTSWYLIETVRLDLDSTDVNVTRDV